MNDSNEPQNTTEPEAKGGCVSSIVLMIGLGMLAVGVLAVFNTAFGWDLVLEVSAAEVKVPKYWDATIAVLVIGGIISLIGWVIGTPTFVRIFRKYKWFVILGSVGMLVGVFFLLNEYDKKIKRDNAKAFAEMDSLRAANPELFEEEDSEEEPAYNPYADNEITFLFSNPYLDTMEVFVDGEKAFEIDPFELEKNELAPGTHQLVAKVKGKEVESVELDFPERTIETKDEITVINVDSFFNIGVLNFQDFYGPDNNKRKGAKTLNYRKEALSWHQHIFTFNVDGASVVLPRHTSLSFSYGTALKVVLVPDELEGDDDQAFDYLIWKFIDEEKKGIVQDGLDFYMLSEAERKEAIRNRLADDFERFEKEN